MKTTTVSLCLAAAMAAGCTMSASTTPSPAATASPVMAAASTPRAAPVPDASLGLAKGSVFDVPTPPAVKANDTAPGEKPALGRPYVIAPPRIPHGVADFLPINQKQNACIDCHEVKQRKAGDPTPIPPSHYTDYRHAPTVVGATVVGARYVCLSCHAATTDAPALVENRFRP